MAGYEAPIDPRELGPHWEVFTQLTGKTALTQCFVEGVQYEAEYAEHVKPGSYNDAEILTLSRAVPIALAENQRPNVVRAGQGIYVLAESRQA